jgi:hypothetical protein
MKLCSTYVICAICSHERDLYYDRHPDAHHSYICMCTHLKLVCILQCPEPGFFPLWEPAAPYKTNLWA